jgi:hydrogenase maturation protease
MTRILVGGVGYRHLRDHSFGILLIERLSDTLWPDAVSIEDLSYNPIAVVQRLQDEAPDCSFDLVIVVGARQRPGRPAGTLAMYRWNQELPAPERVQETIAEAVTGIIDLENTLVVARHFDALPATVVVVECEPEAHECGDALTPVVAERLEQAEAAIRQLLAQPQTAGELALDRLEFERPKHSGIVLTSLTDDPRVH